MASEYLQKLCVENPDVGERYQLKLKLINYLDPFTFKEDELDYSIGGIPPVTNMDIVSYLVLSHSYYTKEQMKAFKSLQAYKYLESGFVKVGTKQVDNFYVLVGKVKHSQKAQAKVLNVWCIVANDGSVSTAHCTCMAGSGEVCSHVGAVLFAAEYANTKKESLSCTDVLAAWQSPSLSAQVPHVPVREMNWGKPFSVHSGEEVPPLTDAEVISALKKVEELGQSSALMRIVEPFVTEMCNKSAVTLKSKLDIFSEEFVGKPHSALIELSKKYDLAVTQGEVVCIEEATRSQFRNPNWYAQRAGRITASKFKEVCRTNPSKPSLSLLKAICYPAQVLFRSKATDWGIKHEDNAAEEYRCNMEEVHEGFVINEVGFMISQKWPQFGASPDRLVYCECCRGGCLEIKCPYVFHQNNIDNIHDYVKLKNSCLVVEDDAVVLNRKHAYYYQVQMQIFVTQLEYCDFVVWSPKFFFKERIYPNFQCWEKYSAIAQEFHANIIMPEILARYFTKQEGAAEIKYWCVCKGVDDRTPMIKCDNGSCEIKWFHFTCVGLSSVPSNIWYCDNCRS